jgi:hypothetical protein
MADSGAGTKSREEPPYGIIAQRLMEGAVVPFLGAGASLATAAAGHAKPPSAAELASILKRAANYPEDPGDLARELAKVASYFVEIGDRDDLRAMLHGVFRPAFPPGDVHALLAEVTNPLLIMTTNYDDLTERALASAGHSFDLVVHPTDRPDIAGCVLLWEHAEELFPRPTAEARWKEPTAHPANQLQVDLGKRTIVYKMHGSVLRDAPDGTRDSYVITEDDYLEFLSRLTTQSAVPAVFETYLRERRFLFLGYGLADWNLRLVLRNLSSRGGPAQRTRRSWAIQRSPSPVEERLWAARQVLLFDVDLATFVQKLRAELNRIASARESRP